MGGYTNELAQTLNWFGAAWEIARKLNPNWSEVQIDTDKMQRIQKRRAALAQLRNQGQDHICRQAGPG
jgi:hypothetical protein